MSKRILIYCIIFSSIIFLFVGYKNQSKAVSEQIIKRAKLMFDLESYMSPEEARQRLGSKATSWEKEEEADINNIEMHSSDNYYSVSVKNFSHLNSSGELRLIFLNKRLMMIMFFPEEFYPYAETLIKNEKLRIKLKHIARNEARIAPNVRVEIVDANLFEMESGPQRSYISWEDIRLSQQYIKIMVESEKAAFQVQVQFMDLYKQWHEYTQRPEVKISSRSQDYINCKPYKDIINLGKPALPYLIQKMRAGKSSFWKEGEFFLWYAVKEISGVNLIKEGEVISEQEKAERYINWWKEQKH